MIRARHSLPDSLSSAAYTSGNPGMELELYNPRNIARDIVFLYQIIVAICIAFHFWLNDNMLTEQRQLVG